MKTKLIILGCGSSVGVPRIDGVWGNCDQKNSKNIRSRCSALISRGNNNILIDASPDLKSQLLSNKINHISSVVFTHEHADQTNGLFELRPFYWIQNKKINIYGNKNTISHLRKSQYYLFRKNKDYPPIIKSNQIKKVFYLGSGKEKIKFNTTEVYHGKIKCTAFVFNKTAYISDSNDLTIVKKKIFQNLNILVIDCLKLTKHPSHFNLDQCIFVHNKLKPKKTILTNLHHDLDYKYLLKNLPNGIVPAYDGFKINL